LVETEDSDEWRKRGRNKMTEGANSEEEYEVRKNYEKERRREMQKEREKH
jgi:hypothetical protein